MLYHSCLMACDNRTRVYLGFEDEYVADKHRALVNFTTNKIGGLPDWHEKTLSAPQCRLCGLHQLLTLQLYAPLESSKYHRTFYIFACINPNCWNQNESWTCLRVQSLEDASKGNLLEGSSVNVPSTASWLADADDWGDDMNDNASEHNGNNMVLNCPPEMSISASNSIDEDLKDELSALHVDDPNANSPTSLESPIGVGAVGRLDSPQASAEIDGEESEVVCIDSPVKPQCNLVSLLHEVTPFPLTIESSSDLKFRFVEIFLAVEEEENTKDVPAHVRDLMLRYQHGNPDSLTKISSERGEAKATDSDVEKYEKGVPKHGDEMFHNFLCRIQENPGQILRYARDNRAALLLYPISGCIGKCRHCGDEMTFELQILPTLIPKLALQPRTDKEFHLEFGTVLIYTCLRSCWASTDSYREEHVIVQAERL